MAELIASAFLSSFFQITLERFASRDFKDLFNKGLVEKLEITLNSINELLDDAEAKQYQSQNVKNWLDNLKHEVYEVDQLLDEIAINVQRKTKARRFFSALTNRFESRIKGLLDKLEFHAKQKDTLGLKDGRCARHELEVGLKDSKRLPMTSLVEESSICGRMDDKEEIIKFLLSDNGSSNNAPILSIVGLGGMGKTTLAQLVYNDSMIQKSFELKAWVYVSESFDIVGLTKAILESFNSSPNSENLELLQCQLQQSLTGKKYLLVLDDVWHGNGETWEHLLLPFNKGSSGSKIIVTTRSREVASSMESTNELNLERLGESDSWSLFSRLAFHNRNMSEYPILESIGKKIVDKCGGLPLAVKTLGNLLRRKFSQSEWIKILETDLWCLSERDSNINPILRLSYQNLPSNMKRCFAYCSVFPKGYEFDKKKLINLWMAEGMLKCCRRQKSEEELGNELFDDLESISFFQQSPHVWDDSFIMHDLVHDLAKSESLKFSLQIEGDKIQDICESTRHILCSTTDLEVWVVISKNICKIKGLRSLLIERQGYYGERLMISKTLQCDIFSKLKYLRMLSFSGCELAELANEIGNLKLLRYLDLSGTNIESLPNSICELNNLETLILEVCSELTELPSDFHKLVCLRHLYLEGTPIKKMPKKIGKLKHLQTISHFVVGEKHEFDIKELESLNLLQGKLCISGLKHVINASYAEQANLKGKQHLEELNMRYSDSFDFNNNGRELDVLEALQPNSNLMRLTLEYYNGNSFPNWLRGFHLPNLVSLKLKSCGLCSHLPPLGQLPSLKDLSISHCDGIKIIGAEFYGDSSTIIPFRSLEVLKFELMGNWEELICLEGFPLVKEIYIRECPELKRALPQNLPSLQKLVIRYCKKLEVSIPKGDNITELDLQKCDRILIKECPTSLKRFWLWKNRYIEFSVEQNLVNNTILEDLKLDLTGFVECPSLDLHCYNSLRSLKIKGWCSSSFLPISLHLFTNLHSLKLYDFPQLESFPREGLPSKLSWLTISNCPKLIALGEDWNLFQLNELSLYDCPELESLLLMGCLPSRLTWLLIHNCPKLIASRDKLGLFQLNSLKTFHVIDEFENVESFPEENLLPQSLQVLTLVNCSKLRIMNYKGFLHLKSLKYLFITNCPSLERLPEEGLPSSLSSLSIEFCPLIKEKYQKEKGERWHTISHIPNVKIDNIKQK